MLNHGGKLREAAQQYNIPLNQWVDLSTGINPNGWQPKTIPTVIWNRLPEAEDNLLNAAQQYYGCDTLLAVAGSQAAIQVLPKALFTKTDSKNVGVLTPTYSEHAHAWGKHGHHVTPMNTREIENKIHELDALVIVNPNNPTGELISIETLTRWRKTLANKNGWLIIDEAFMDCSPEKSMLASAPTDNLIILRSIGKFFGLAGIRVGFVSAPSKILNNLNEILGPWTISGPARLCAEQALGDFNWQKTNHHHLQSSSIRLISLLSRFHLTPDGSTHLFSWIKTERAHYLHEKLAKKAVLTRLFSEPSSLRFGLPKNEKQWQQLSKALESIS